MSDGGSAEAQGGDNVQIVRLFESKERMRYISKYADKPKQAGGLRAEGRLHNQGREDREPRLDRVVEVREARVQKNRELS